VSLADLVSSPPQLERRIVLTDDAAHAVAEITRASLTDDEVQYLKPLATVDTQTGTGKLTLRRNSHHRVGQLAFRNHTIVVPPAISGTSFMVLLLTALGLRSSELPRKFIKELETEAALTPEDWAEQFDVLLAYLYVRWTEGILASHIAQTYVRQEERLTTLKGKPQWNLTMGRHPAEGVHCSYFQLQTDNIFNRLVLAGLAKAASLLRGTPWDDRVQNQLFIWHSLARVTIPRPDAFALAYGKISRLTEHYRPVLRLGEALLFSHAPQDLFSGGRQWVQGLVFDVPYLYERWLAELLRGGLAPYGLMVREQLAQQGAFVDGFGNKYRKVQPDIVIFRGARPVAVIDAKYKPRYVESDSPTMLPRSNKVSNADLYQMFFYQARLKYRYEIEEPIPSALVSPRLPGSGPLPTKELRSIRWKAGDAADVHSLEVLAVPLQPMLERLGEGASATTTLAEAPELGDFLRGLLSLAEQQAFPQSRAGKGTTL